MKQELLNIQGLSKSFHSHEVFNNLSFNVFSGEAVGMLIPPLAGKTTLSKILQGTDDYVGTVRFCGSSTKGSLKCYNEAGKILCLTAQTNLIPNLSIGENMFLVSKRPALRFMLGQKDNKAAQEYLAELGFDISANELVKNTDIFTQHMVLLTQAIHNGVQLIVFDDPSVYYDQEQLKTVQKLLSMLKRRGIAILWLGSESFPFDTAILDRIVLVEDYQKTRTIFHPEKFNQSKTSLPQPVLDSYTGVEDNSSRLALRMESVSCQGLQPIDLSLKCGSSIGITAPQVQTFQLFSSLFIPNQEPPSKLQGRFFIGNRYRIGREIYKDYGLRYVVLTDTFAHDQLLKKQTILENVYLPLTHSRSFNMFSTNNSFRKFLRQEIEDRLKISSDEQELPAESLDKQVAQELVLFRIELQRPDFIVYCSSYSQVDDDLQSRLEKYFCQYMKYGIGILIAAPGLNRFDSVISSRYELERQTFQNGKKRLANNKPV